MKQIIIASLSALCISLPMLSHAQSGPTVRDILKSNSGDTRGGDCTASKEMLDNNTSAGGLDAIFNFKGDSGKGDKTFRFYTKHAVQRALDGGYNYAVMSPLDISNFRRSRSVVRYGWGTARKGTEYSQELRSYELPCYAVDDIAASDLMWDTRTSGALDEGGALVDLRQLSVALDLDVNIPPRKRAISPARYKRPGDRERFDAMFPVKAAAAACRTGMVPSGLRDFRPVPSARDKAAEIACLEAHRSDASRVGWTTFPLEVAAAADTVKTRGYTLNRPAISDGAPPSDGENVQAWGKGWTDVSSTITAPTGLYLYSPKQKKLLIASSGLDTNQLLDLGVYLTGSTFISTKDPGIGLKDTTPEYRQKFDRSLAALQDKGRDSVSKRSRRRDLKITDRDIERQERDVTRARERMEEYRDGNDEEAIANMQATMAAFPSADFDVNEMRAQLAKARSLGVTRMTQKLAKEEAELAQMRQDQAIEIASQDAAISQVVADPSVATTPSQNETTSYRKAIYTAFETYPNVMVMDVSTIRSGGTCYSSMLVCADKLQVYNTLGATYGKPGFTPLSEPFNYKPYGTR